MRSCLLIALATVLLLGCGGGSRWNLVITSDPPEALVHVNEFPRGVTPVTVPYLWIGTYRIDLEHPGHQRIHDEQRIGKPWYNWIPLMGLIIDSLPVPVRHSEYLHYRLSELPQETF